MSATMPKSSSLAGHSGEYLTPAERKLRRERWTAIGVIALFGVLMALLMFLASWGGAIGPSYDYWMMP